MHISAQPSHLVPPKPSLGQQAVVFGLLFYKSALSPMLPSCCKFYPTCSIYAKEAVERHGVARGLLLAARRLLRCRPFAPGGHDPVPDA
jgi:putative membrane protein insertion efficiency factor